MTDKKSKERAKIKYLHVLQGHSNYTKERDDQSVERGQKNDKTIQADDGETQKPYRSQATELIELCSGIDFFHDGNSKAFARFKSGDHMETWPVRSRGFSVWIKGLYFRSYNKAVSNRGFEDARGTLEYKALFDSKGNVKPAREVFHRVAPADGAIYIDLCNDQWQAVKITAKEWNIVDNPPVYFIRSNIEKPLPSPEHGGSIDMLRSFINCPDDDDWRMIVAWMLSALRPGFPYPVLTIQGEQGSAKSTTTKLIKLLIDPDGLPKRSMPRKESDMYIAAKNSWILPFDNLSGMSAAMSDVVCLISTGGSSASRALYTDDEENALSAMNPVILNGIDDIAERGDLLSRAIVINLPHIDDKNRKDEKAIKNEFYKARPKILGALFDAISGAMKELPNTDLPKKPRMADFALWSTAAEKALGWNKYDFMKTYNMNLNKAINQGIEADPFATAVIQLLEDKKVFEGTPSQLLAELRNGYVDDQTFRSRAMPTSRGVRGVRNRLKRIKQFLRKKNIYYDEMSSRKKRTLKLVMRKTAESNCANYATAQTASDQGKKGAVGAQLVEKGAVKKKQTAPNKPRQNGKGAEVQKAQLNSVGSLNAHSEEGFEI